MCSLSRPSQIQECGGGSTAVRAVATILMTLIAAFTWSQAAAVESLSAPSSPAPNGAPNPLSTTPKQEPHVPVPKVLNFGSNFLERLGRQATSGSSYEFNNPGGGGASQALEPPRYRVWGEGYGLSLTTGPQGDFLGDRRRIFGGIAGIGTRIAPGVNIGFSVDQSRSNVEVPLALQSATVDLTQFGFTTSVDKGPWTWALALVHGFGNVNSKRDTALGSADASYATRLDGGLTELSYYWDLQHQSRIVPKLALEYVRASSAPFQEVGGLFPVAESSAYAQRARVMIGSEIGHYWIFGRQILDLSAYGKFVDNFYQNYNSVIVSLGPQSIVVPGVAESQYGADAGASASLYFSNSVRFYLNYDGRFRTALQSHQGTLGVELKW